MFPESRDKGLGLELVTDTLMAVYWTDLSGHKWPVTLLRLKEPAIWTEPSSPTHPGKEFIAREDVVKHVYKYRRHYLPWSQR